ncbi:GAF domain-containing protein [Rhodococcus sp. T7]|uniref:GAF domain-containing protein n=1 Tax=Rhodococcus sp. T7 TaxID=627444 RepID=UPI001357038C|nr:GAF domain-containing protein [Rhodococcus sp. T7]
MLADGSDSRAARQVVVTVAAAAADVLETSSAELDKAGALRTLVEVAKQLHASEADADAVLEFIVERAHELIGADVTWLALADYEHNESRVTAMRGARTPEFAAMRVQLGQGITGLALSAGDVVTLDDEAHTDDRLPPHIQDSMRGEGLVSLVCAPLFHNGDLIGNLLVGFRRRAAVPRDAQYLLSALSSQAAITIANARLYASLREQNDLLKRHSVLSSVLTEASLAGGGQHAVAAELARAIGSDIVVEREDDHTRAWRYPAGSGAPSEIEADPPGGTDRGSAAAIRAGGRGSGGCVWPSPGH